METFDTPNLVKDELESRSISELFKDILDREPKIITDFVPDNGSEQKKAFLDGDIRNPDNHYPNLETKQYGQNALETQEIAQTIAGNPELNLKFKDAYLDFAERYVKVNRFLELARDIKGTDADRTDLEAEYMALGGELYGEPEENIYRSLLSEKVGRIDAKDFNGRAFEIRTELHDLLGDVNTEADEERFRPSSETIEWMHGVVGSLYGSMLEHVPDDKETFNAEEAKSLIEEIIQNEFGDSAEGSRVDIEDAQSVNVKASEKRIIIPPDRVISHDAMRSVIITHEIGVHMLRAIQGASTDLRPLETGLSGYADSEEGLGVVMQQALTGKYREAGVDHYVTIGLAHFEQKDFRDTFEIKWRLAALAGLKSGAELTDAAVEKARSAAYGATMRTYRGTDRLPFFKDLSYYNGARDMWQHLESICGDDLKFMFVLMGKANPANIENERLLYETRSV